MRNLTFFFAVKAGFATGFLPENQDMGTPRMRTSLIQRLETGHLQRSDLCRPRKVAEITGKTSSDGPLLAPIRPLGKAIAAFFVPDGFSGWATRNGVPLDSGMHTLEHGDEICVDGHVFWIAAEAQVEQAIYDPEQHGSDMSCYLTRAPILPGEDIVICPGLAGHSCGVVYKAQAWDLAMKSANPLRCRNCGFHPSDAVWNPPAPKSRSCLDELLRLATRTGN
jgi:hypothetical protein